MPEDAKTKQEGRIIERRGVNLVETKTIKEAAISFC